MIDANKMTRLMILLTLLPTPLLAEPTEVIHIQNYHFVPPEVFATNLKDQDSEITQEQIDKQYAALMKKVELTQKAQVKILRRMISRYKLRGVYIEGLTEQNHKEAIKTIESLKMHEKEKEDPLNQSNRDHLSWQDKIVFGAAGQLVANGELKTLLVTEDSKAMKAANPIKSGGKIVFNKEASEKREDAIVKNLLKGDGVVVIILGSNHSLRDNLKRLAKGVKYKCVLPVHFVRKSRSHPSLKIRKVGE